MELNFPGLSGAARLTAVGAGSLREATDFAMNCGGFPDRAAALAAGERLRAAFRLAFVRLNVGADWGADQASLSFNKGLRDALQESGINVRPDVLGLVVYEDIGTPTLFLGVKATGVVSRSLPEVLAALQAAYAQGDSGDDRIVLALQLFGWSFFESTARARFLLLITCIEVLVERQPRSKAAKAHIDKLMEGTRASTLEQTEKGRLLEGLSNLRSESIGAACSRVVAQHGAGGDVPHWEIAHRLRHKLSHAGATVPNLTSTLATLQEVVRRVLLHVAGWSPDH